MKFSEDRFLVEIMGRMKAEHGVSDQWLIKEGVPDKIRAAYVEEGDISADEMDDLFHGDEDGQIDEALQQKYPKLNEIALSMYVGDSPEEDEDDDEDDEEEDEDETEEEGDE